MGRRFAESEQPTVQITLPVLFHLSPQLLLLLGCTSAAAAASPLESLPQPRMATEPQPAEKKKKAPLPKVVTLNKALKLAQAWVDKMSPSDPDEPSSQDFVSRPSGLGLGAKAAPGVKRAAPTDPVERRLLGKVNAAHKRRSMEVEDKTDKEANQASDDDSGEPESRTSAFNKKRTLPSVTSMTPGKKAK